MSEAVAVVVVEAAENITTLTDTRDEIRGHLPPDDGAHLATVAPHLGVISTPTFHSAEVTVSQKTGDADHHLEGDRLRTLDRALRRHHAVDIAIMTFLDPGDDVTALADLGRLRVADIAAGTNIGGDRDAVMIEQDP